MVASAAFAASKSAAVTAAMAAIEAELQRRLRCGSAAPLPGSWGMRLYGARIWQPGSLGGSDEDGGCEESSSEHRILAVASVPRQGSTGGSARSPEVQHRWLRDALNRGAGEDVSARWVRGLAQEERQQRQRGWQERAQQYQQLLRRLPFLQVEDRSAADSDHGAPCLDLAPMLTLLRLAPLPPSTMTFLSSSSGAPPVFVRLWGLLARHTVLRLAAHRGSDNDARGDTDDLEEDFVDVAQLGWVRMPRSQQLSCKRSSSSSSALVPLSLPPLPPRCLGPQPVASPSMQLVSLFSGTGGSAAPGASNALLPEFLPAPSPRSPVGLRWRFDMVSNWGDPEFVGLDGLQLIAGCFHTSTGAADGAAAAARGRKAASRVVLASAPPPPGELLPRSAQLHVRAFPPGVCSLRPFWTGAGGPESDGDDGADAWSDPRAAANLVRMFPPDPSVSELAPQSQAHREWLQAMADRAGDALRGTAADEHPPFSPWLAPLASALEPRLLTAIAERVASSQRELMAAGDGVGPPGRSGAEASIEARFNAAGPQAGDASSGGARVTSLLLQFDEPVCIGGIRVFNSSEGGGSRGVREMRVVCDDSLVAHVFVPRFLAQRRLGVTGGGSSGASKAVPSGRIPYMRPDRTVLLTNHPQVARRWSHEIGVLMPSGDGLDASSDPDQGLTRQLATGEAAMLGIDDRRVRMR